MNVLSARRSTSRFAERCGHYNRWPQRQCSLTMMESSAPPTAFGKTAVAAWLIAERRVKTLVLVHRQQLLDQWRERLAIFLDIPLSDIGQIGGGKSSRTGIIDVGMLQSLNRRGKV